jgi:folate-dependent phosphoribosylglycinamide formyltransferase PurN
MRVVLVTSEVTHVPENYSAVIEGLADHPSIVGLIIVLNKKFKTLLQAVGMILTFSAPRLGLVLLQNLLFNRKKQREYHYKRFGKFIYLVNDINSQQIKKILQYEKIDLVLNARADGVYSKELLSIPPLGCYNIHHGILPYQRGVFCDFWAHYDQVVAGFSIHKMTTNIVDSDIIISCRVNSSLKNYIEHLSLSAQQEKKVCIEFFKYLEKEKNIIPLQHIKTYATQHRKYPSFRDFYTLQSRGTKI